MIKFKMIDKNDKLLIGLGLTDKNIELLKNGMPISIDGENLDIDMDIFIFFGKDEQTIIDQLSNVGLINSLTRIT